MDYRINANQGFGAFNAARLRGIPAEILIFPDENHWVLKPQNGVLWQRTFFGWLDKWLKIIFIYYLLIIIWWIMHGAGILLNDKAMAFAVRIVNLYKWLRDDKGNMCLASSFCAPAQASEPTSQNRELQ